ncbi:unnamed protein product [Ectocarpus sp. CCAP 1310/34]|nr:unnamed protein product [Ectocarpus sp. CCAP 1310/34]
MGRQPDVQKTQATAKRDHGTQHSRVGREGGHEKEKHRNTAQRPKAIQRTWKRSIAYSREGNRAQQHQPGTYVATSAASAALLASTAVPGRRFFPPNAASPALFLFGPEMAALSASASRARWRFADASASCLCHFLMNHAAPSSTFLYHTAGSLALSFRSPPSFSSPMLKATRSSPRRDTQSLSCPPRYPMPPAIAPCSMRLGRRLSSMRIIKPTRHSLRLRTVASMVSSQPAWMRAWA